MLSRLKLSSRNAPAGSSQGIAKGNGTGQNPNANHCVNDGGGFPVGPAPAVEMKSVQIDYGKTVLGNPARNSIQTELLDFCLEAIFRKKPRQIFNIHATGLFFPLLDQRAFRDHGSMLAQNHPQAGKSASVVTFLPVKRRQGHRFFRSTIALLWPLLRLGPFQQLSSRFVRQSATCQPRLGLRGLGRPRRPGSATKGAFVPKRGKERRQCTMWDNETGNTRWPLIWPWLRRSPALKTGPLFRSLFPE
jgi:hypothetical protein